MKLISMTDFVLQKTLIFDNANSTYKDCEKAIEAIFKYANLLKQPLELWMLVPCDENNLPLKKPSFFYTEENIEKLEGIEKEAAIRVNKKVEQYEKAKEKVLFDGFEYVESQAKATLLGLELSVSPYTKKGDFYITKKEKKGYRTWFKLPDIESLVQCGLTLKVSF